MYENDRYNNGKHEAIQATIQELEYIKKASKDYILPNDAIKVNYDESYNHFIVELDTPDGVLKITPTTIALSQICDKMGIPRTYIKRCLEHNRQTLLAYNINDWLQRPNNYMVRTLGNTLRAFLSDRFKLIDNYDIAMLFLKNREELKQKGIDIDINSIRLSETNLYIKSTSPQLRELIKPDKDNLQTGDVVNGGIIISNSDIGKGRFSIKSFINVLVCQNGLIGEHEFSRIHIGKKLEQGEIQWSENTHTLQSETFWSQAEDMIKTAYNPAIFKQWIDKINGDAQEIIQKPVKAINHIIKKFNINENLKEQLLNEFSKKGNNKWSLTQAVTRVAQDQKNYDTQIEMEKAGTQILKIPVPILEAD